MDVQEVVRLLRDGASDREVAALVGLNRRTVARYRRWAQEQGLLAGTLPSLRELEERLQRTLPAVLPPQQVSSLEAYAAEVAAYRAQAWRWPRSGRAWRRPTASRSATAPSGGWCGGWKESDHPRRSCGA